MEKEYVVVVHKGVDLEEFDAEMAAEQGHGPIPSRSVDIANPRIGSRRMTHWAITDEEAEELRKDPRVLSVEIPPDQRDDISIGLNGRQTSNFYRGSALNSAYVNWGLARSGYVDQPWGNLNEDLTLNYDYGLDGTGVDVVIQDSGIDPNHPEWQDYSGTTRLQQIDWYTESGLTGSQSANHYRDADGHGTHCAGIAAGLTYGFAKGAHIYSQKLAGLETLAGSDGTGISISDAFDAIRLWHLAKTNGRPTIVNMSWGYGANVFGNPTNGTYRGTPWVYGVDYTTRAALFAATGVSITFNELYNLNPGVGEYFRVPVRVPSVDAEVEDMIAAGIHVCIAAGNNWHKVDLPTGLDYNNEVTFAGTTRNYHQGSSPYTLEAFMVGNIDSTRQNIGGGNYQDKTALSSTRGPGVNIWAPGTDIMSTTSTLKDSGYNDDSVTYPLDANYEIMSISGTSMASPQVCGLGALYLQSKPNLTPAQLQEKMISDSSSSIYSTGSDTDYDQINTSLLGSEQRVLKSRYYNRNPVQVTGPININNTIPYKNTSSGFDGDVSLGV